MMTAPAWLQQIKPLGRTHWHNHALWMAYSGSGVAFEVTARRCTIRLHGDSTASGADPDAMCARYALYVNGERVLADLLTEPDRTLTVFDGAEVRTACVMLIKLSESAMSTMAVSAIENDGTLVPLPDRAHLVEFVGDSITCGYGVDTASETDPFHTGNEDVTRAYAWQAAELLNVDRSMVSLSGYGVLSGWTGDPNTPSPSQLIPLYYEKLGFSYASCDGEQVQQWAWSFEGREPDVIVVNLGTNDASYTVNDADKQAQYRDKYKAFLRQIRRCNPHARLLCVLGVMGDVLYPSLEQAVAEYSDATGDQRVEAMHLEAIRPQTEGYAADYHPTAVTHARVARVVAQRISELLAQG